MPEDSIWDIDSPGFGHDLARFKIARAIAQRALVNVLNLRKQPGANWLVDGVAGWAAINCVEQQVGSEAVLALKAYFANDIMEAFSANYQPIRRVEDNLHDWMPAYSMLALDSWSDAARAVNERELLALINNLDSDSLLQSLSAAFGAAQAETLLGLPRTYDVTVLGQQPTSQRWIWRNGGWHRELVGGGQQSLVSKLVIANGAAASDYWFDRYAAFERSVDDNLAPRATE